MGGWLTQRHIEEHHHRETEHDPGSGEMTMIAFLGFGDDFFGDDEDHRTGGKGQGIGQDGLSDCDEQSAEDTTDRLDHSGELPPEEALPAGDPFAAKRDGDGSAFGQILDPDPHSQSDRAGKGSAGKVIGYRAKSDAHGKPFREVMQRDREKEQRGFAPGGLDPFPLADVVARMHVRQKQVNDPQEGSSEEEAYDGRHPVPTGHLDRGI